ncbi:MAG: acyltransferase [Pedobacter sp.]|nr:MAG: acyltransferase [Pedobacter sp.]
MHATNNQPQILKTKQHFELLDGLRGIAAISVLVFHFMEFLTPDYNDNFTAHSYLAVDFFFCLSGFVIAYAYDNKIERIGKWEFLKLRLIRLHPLVVIGSVLGLLSFILDPFVNLYSAYGAGQTFLMFLSSSLLVPYPIVPERYFNLFHLNPPTWSLFWEYIANIFYIIVLVKLRNKVLLTLTVIAATALCYEAYRSNYLGVGWGGDTFLGGGFRVFYSFLAGMLVYRSKWLIKSKLSFLPIGVLLLAAFLFPFSDKYNFIIDPILVIIYFPFLVALGAGAGLNTAYSKICKFLGDISYPLYMVHYPFLWLFYSYIEKSKPVMSEMILITVIGVPLLIGIAYMIMVFIDVPVRKYFTNRLKQK